MRAGPNGQAGAYDRDRRSRPRAGSNGRSSLPVTLTAVPTVARPEFSVIVLCYRARRRRSIASSSPSTSSGGGGRRLRASARGEPFPGRPDPTGGWSKRSRRTTTTGSHGDRGEARWDGLGHAQRARGREGGYLIVIDGDAQNPADESLRGTGARGDRRRGDEGPADRVLRRSPPARLSTAYNSLFPAALRNPRDLGRQRQAEGVDPRGVRGAGPRAPTTGSSTLRSSSPRGAGPPSSSYPSIFHRNVERGSFVPPPRFSSS